MILPTGSLQSLFENRDGAALTLSTARARVTITRMESKHYTGPRYRLSGDSAPGIVDTSRDYLEPANALIDAIAVLDAHSSDSNF